MSCLFKLFWNYSNCLIRKLLLRSKILLVKSTRLKSLPAEPFIFYQQQITEYFLCKYCLKLFVDEGFVYVNNNWSILQTQDRSGSKIVAGPWPNKCRPPWLADGKKLGFEWAKRTQLALKFLRFFQNIFKYVQNFSCLSKQFLRILFFLQGYFFIKIQKFKKGSVQNEVMYILYKLLWKVLWKVPISVNSILHILWIILRKMSDCLFAAVFHINKLIHNIS